MHAFVFFAKVFVNSSKHGLGEFPWRAPAVVAASLYTGSGVPDSHVTCASAFFVARRHLLLCRVGRVPSLRSSRLTGPGALATTQAAVRGARLVSFLYEKVRQS